MWGREAHSIATHKPNFSATQDYSSLASLGCLHTNLVILLSRMPRHRVMANSRSTEEVLWEPGAGRFVVQICQRGKSQRGIIPMLPSCFAGACATKKGSGAAQQHQSPRSPKEQRLSSVEGHAPGEARTTQLQLS